MNSIDQDADEINLRELFVKLWHYKILIIFMCLLGVLFGGYNAINAKKIYSSIAIFAITKSKDSNGLAGQLTNFSGLAGMNLSSNESVISTKKVEGRIFIEQINKILKFEEDPYFNPQSNETFKDPIWKSKIKKILNYKSPTSDINESMWQKIVEVYKKNISIDTLKNDVIIVKVDHEDKFRASRIANVIMETIIADKKYQKLLTQNKQLEYLSNTVADSLNDLELAQEKLKIFAIKNSALPMEDFAIGSIELDNLRAMLNQTIELYDAASELQSILMSETVNEKDYIYLNRNFPIVDQVEFRRILGLSEITSSWSWPNIVSVNAVIDTLNERKKRLLSEIDVSQKNAERFGDTLKVYGKLKREEKTAEATYKVLIEQVKSQSLMAGYLPENAEIYEYAAPATSHSEPRISIYLALGLLFGLFLGILLSIGLSIRAGVHFSKDSLLKSAKSQFTINIKSLKSLHKKDFSVIIERTNKNPQLILRNLILEIHKNTSNFVLISSLNSYFKSNKLAYIIASHINSSKIKIAIIDLSSKTKLNNDGIDLKEIDAFQILETQGCVSILKHKSISLDPLMQRDFLDNLQPLKKYFNLIFICADDEDSLSLVRAMSSQEVYHIVSARTKYTKQDLLSQLTSGKPIQGLLYV